VQMLLNLIINAYDAMGETGTLQLGATETETEVLLTVQDDGCGIDEAELEKIYVPFYTSKGPAKGTGLGLAIAKEIAGEHEGSISVSSKPGRGSCFTVHLKKCIPDEDGALEN